jgi:hypothetical protein
MKKDNNYKEVLNKRIESIKEKSLDLFQAVHSIGLDLFEIDPDRVEDDPKSVVIEIQRFLNKKNK